MDTIQQCLSLAHVPFLYPAFSAFNLIWQCIQEAPASKRQLEVLAQSIAQLMIALDGEYRRGRLFPARMSTAFNDLCGFVRSTSWRALMCTLILQALGRHLSFRSKGSIIRVSKVTNRQGSKDRSHRRILSAH